jgi:hypothetical protein
LGLGGYFVIQITSKSTYYYYLIDRHSLLNFTALNDVAIDNKLGDGYRERDIIK